MPEDREQFMKQFVFEPYNRKRWNKIVRKYGEDYFSPIRITNNPALAAGLGITEKAFSDYLKALGDCKASEYMRDESKIAGYGIKALPHCCDIMGYYKIPKWTWNNFILWLRCQKIVGK